ncbi:unnamed protein product [Ectocarpus fasciculatus]
MADVASAMPGFLRSVALTTFVFSFYERSMEHTRAERAGMCTEKELLLTSFGAGLSGGAIHGLLYYLSDSLYYAVSEKPLAARRVGPWTMLSHSAVYGSLFGSYECTKRVLFKYMGVQDHLQIKTVMCVSAAGAVSGYISEVVTHHSKWIEREGLTSALAAARPLKLPSPHSCLPGIIMSTFGFLAYEYVAL